MSDEKITIIYDTYCGWCHGASEVFDTIEASGAEVEVLHRHLFEGDYRPKMSEGKGEQIVENLIPRIEALTGQEFTQAYKDNIAMSPTEVLASKYSAQAAALVHDQGPAREFAIRRKLEDLHFGQGVSSTDRDAIVAALIEEGITPEDAEKLGTPELEAKAEALAGRAKALMAAVGSRGVPTVLRSNGDRYSVVDHQAYYGRADALPANVSNLATV
ncbi:DsbA family protein [Tateyamaria sp.]|uniref:DsbA family protein n=1 Tax=Tateyamaria sp. TaxID=1929288 RepID=UPI003B216924